MVGPKYNFANYYFAEESWFTELSERISLDSKLGRIV